MPTPARTTTVPGSLADLVAKVRGGVVRKMPAFWSTRLTTVSMKARSKTRRKFSKLLLRARAARSSSAAHVSRKEREGRS
jgi:hypothetical protein